MTRPRSLSLRTLASSTVVLLVAALAFTAPSGCYKDDPLFCAGEPDDTCGEVIAKTCKDSAECTSPGKLVCDTEVHHICVQCTTSSAAACDGLTPTCGENNSCRACNAHKECGSSACLPDGSCGDDRKVAFVSPAGIDNPQCSQASPCARITAALATTRPYIKLTGSLDERVVVSRSVVLLADPGTKLTSTTPNTVPLRVDGGIDVEVRDLTVTGVLGTSGNGIVATGGARLGLVRVDVANNGGLGVEVSGGKLTMTSSSISFNGGGGVSVRSAATFDLTNNFIFRNGVAETSSLGGLELSVGPSPQNRLEFNTIADNRSLIISGGVICNVPGFAAANNLIIRNSLAGSTTIANAQTAGGCSYPTSRIQGDLTDVLFKDPEPPAPYDYGLLAGSKSIDQAMTTSTVELDFQGDPRPQGDQKDMGADEYNPSRP
jgi:hypothetical protein